MLRFHLAARPLDKGEAEQPSPSTFPRLGHNIVKVAVDPQTTLTNPKKDTGTHVNNNTFIFISD